MKIIIPLFALLAMAAQAATPTPKTVWAGISVSRPVFVLGREEVDFFFSAMNDTEKAVPYEDIRGEGVLIINGEELKESGMIFGNGPREITKMLQPGKVTLFGVRLTNYFKKLGDYEVVWKGKQFRTKPVYFRLVEKL